MRQQSQFGNPALFVPLPPVVVDSIRKFLRRALKNGESAIEARPESDADVISVAPPRSQKTDNV